MRTRACLRHAASALLLMGVFAGQLAAQDRLELLSGRTYDGAILSNDGETVEIRLNDSSTLKLKYDSL